MRPARPDDRELFFVMRRDGFRRYVEATKPWDDEVQRASANEDFAALPVEIIERDGIAIGYQIVERKADHWRLDEIALVASERNRCIGSDLVRAIMAAAHAARLPPPAQLPAREPRAPVVRPTRLSRDRRGRRPRPNGVAVATR